jgi:hypothetical protein
MGGTEETHEVMTEKAIWTSRQAFMTIGIEAKSKHHGFAAGLLLAGIRH